MTSPLYTGTINFSVVPITMKMFVAVAVAVMLLSGCSTVGDLEVLNDMGKTGKAIGSVGRTIDSSCKVLTGRSCDSVRVDTSTIKRTVGGIKSLPYVLNTKSVPHILQEVQQFLH